MIKIVLFLLLIPAHFCFGQDSIDTSSIYYAFHGRILKSDYVGTIESPEQNALYRGYPNVINPVIQNSNDLPMQVYCSGCTLSKRGDSYIVKVGRGRSATIALTLRDGDSIIPVLRKTYRIVNLPSPDLYWGESRSGRSSNTKSTKLTAKYSEGGVALDSEFSVVSWTMTYDDKTVSGSGGDLSNASLIYKELKRNRTIIIDAIVKGPDGIDRSLSGVWIVKK